MEATARNLLESYCPDYFNFWTGGLTSMTFILGRISDERAKTYVISEIMTPMKEGGRERIFKTSYMRKRCLLLASVGFPDSFKYYMSERYAELCTDDYNAKALLEVEKLEAKDRIKKNKQAVKDLQVAHKKATRVLKTKSQ
jgi:hypothetical protein